ncbi:MAG TPA: glycosyltransferase [Terriglobia bacterium]|nr:glycosyltransferase [Terriglobia bacterium]
MKHRPRISIGLGVYNGGKFLRPTLDSIVAQTFGDFELIISDNASTDGTEETCREFAARDTRIRYSRNPTNIGLFNNFNRVFHLSSAQYFRWSSADDLFDRRSLEECVKVLDDHPEVVLCYPKTVLIDGDGRTIRGYDDNLNLRSPDPSARMRSVLRNIGLVNVQYGLIRSSALRRTSLMADYPGSDIVLIAELALHGRFWEIPEQLFFRRMHDGASSALKDRPRESAEKFWNVNPTHGLDLYYWTHRFHNMKSIFRAPISAWEKLRVAYSVGDYIFRSRNAHLKELLRAGSQLVRGLRHV